MAKIWKSKFGTGIDIEGLTPAQIKQVQDLANKGYGTKAASMVKTWQKSAAKPGKTQAPKDPADPNAHPKDIEGAAKEATQESGAINSTSTQAAIDKITGKANPDFSGGPSITTVDPAMRQKYEDSTYQDLTRNFDRDKGRDMEAVKQDLANRGIPFDPADSSSLYGRTVQGVDEKYKGYFDQAKNSAITTGASLANQDVNTNNAAATSFVDNVIKKDQAPIQDAAALAKMGNQDTIISALMTKYGIDKTAATTIAVKKIGSGGGGGSSSSSDPVVI